jgi:anti-sigma B factor antagonist
MAVAPDDRALTGPAWTDPPLECDVCFFADQAVISARGELDFATAPLLLRELRELLLRPIRGVTVNLTQLSFIDSCGAQSLLTAQRAAADQGVAFTLASVPRHARQLLELTGFGERFNVTW